VLLRRRILFGKDEHCTHRTFLLFSLKWHGLKDFFQVEVVFLENIPILNLGSLTVCSRVRKTNRPATLNSVLSVRPYWKGRLRPEEFSWNSIFWIFLLNVCLTFDENNLNLTRITHAVINHIIKTDYVLCEVRFESAEPVEHRAWSNVNAEYRCFLDIDCKYPLLRYWNHGRLSGNHCRLSILC
jgi:hypothetical protein